MSNGTGPKETQTTKPPYESKDLDVHIREMFNPFKDQQEVYEKSRSRIKRREKSRDYCVYNLKKKQYQGVHRLRNKQRENQRDKKSENKIEI